MKDNFQELHQELRGLYPLEYETKNYNSLTSIGQIQKLIRKARGEELKRRLEECETGIENWKKFQDICFDLVNLTLEKNEFEECRAIPEISGDFVPFDSKGVRKDIVIPLKPKKRKSYDNIKTIWDELRDEPWFCKYIIFDAKNFKGKIKDKEVYQMFHYLNPKGSRIGIIFSRKYSLDKSGKAAVRRIREDNYMVFVLDENQIKEWIDDYVNEGHVRIFFQDLLTRYDHSFG
jgi:hypothetical protein